MIKLYDLRVGSVDFANDPWVFITEKGESYLEKKSIRQRIRLDSSIDFDTIDYKPGFKVNGMSAYELDADLEWRNSKRNFNPLFIRPKRKPCNDLTVIYLTLTKNILLSQYSLKEGEILQTYSGNGFVGCAIVINKPLTPNAVVIDIDYYHTKKDVAQRVRVFVNPKGIPQFKTLKASKEKIDFIMSQKTRTTPMKFKVIPAQHHCELTSCWLTSEKYLSKVKGVLKRAKNVTVLAQNGQTIEELYDAIPAGTRAITLCGIDSVLEQIRRKRICYVFQYDPKTDSIRCLRSN